MIADESRALLYALIKHELAPLIKAINERSAEAVRMADGDEQAFQLGRANGYAEAITMIRDFLEKGEL